MMHSEPILNQTCCCEETINILPQNPKTEKCAKKTRLPDYSFLHSLPWWWHFSRLLFYRKGLEPKIVNTQHVRNKLQTGLRWFLRAGSFDCLQQSSKLEAINPESMLALTTFGIGFFFTGTSCSTTKTDDNGSFSDACAPWQSQIRKQNCLLIPLRFWPKQIKHQIQFLQNNELDHQDPAQKDHPLESACQNLGPLQKAMLDNKNVGAGNERAALHNTMDTLTKV